MVSNLTRTNEGGSVVSFVVVGIVLVALVVGGVYLVQKRGENTQPPSPVVSTNPANQPASSAPAQSPAKSPTVPSSKPSSPANPPIVTAPQTGTAPSTAPLPKTGPSDLMAGGLMTAILLGTVLGYINSRRSLAYARSER